MEQPRAGSAGERRGRHAAPPSGPRGPLDRVLAAALAILAAARERVVAPAAGRAAPLRGRVAAGTRAAVAAVREGPVPPWLSKHRMTVLIGGALVVSAIALGGAAAMIATPTPAGVEDEAAEAGDRPRPGSKFTMPTPAPSSPAPTRTPAPSPTATPAPDGTAVPDATDAPEPTTAPVEPTTEPVDESPGNSGNSPGASNRPDKDKG
ncbi:hypothetical protein [Agromyces arachidis]|uniref:hypothetical protein n=1 Tax=Agromyces arachidis TaxID=766966 RepID=UPI0040576F0D